MNNPKLMLFYSIIWQFYNRLNWMVIAWNQWWWWEWVGCKDWWEAWRDATNAYCGDGVGHMNTFDKMYGKACPQGQMVLHVDSNLVRVISSGRVSGKLTGLFAQDTQGPGPNPQNHSRNPIQTTPWTFWTWTGRRTPAKQLPYGWRDRQEYRDMTYLGRDS